jgi:tyrosine-specific transport protein
MSDVALIKSKQILGVTLLVTGCCIGAGMVGLPVVSALAGLMPSTLAMFLVYLFTTVTGLLLLEVTLWFEERVNLMSIAAFSLGKTGKLLTMVLFLFLFYCLFVAYMDAGGQLFSEMLSVVLQHQVSREMGILTCVLFVAGFTYTGIRFVNSINKGMLLGLVLSYVALVIIGLPRIHTENLFHMNLSATIATVPILLICFGYQNLVPSITYYLKRNVNAIRFCIVFGNFIPFIVYFIWNMTILGMINATEMKAIPSVDMVTELLKGGSDSSTVIFFIKSFSLFAILTSFLPSAISFVDFLKDGFKVVPEYLDNDNLVYYALVFVPPLICSLIYPHLFLQALEFAGGFIDVLLFGILPAVVVLIGRYRKLIKAPYQVAGGSFTPVLVILASLFILYIKLS